mgnify:CR=1 FL=1
MVLSYTSNKEYLLNLNTRNIGLSVWLISLYGGSAGVSITTKPFKF